jgi:hypothetical protein
MSESLDPIAAAAVPPEDFSELIDSIDAPVVKPRSIRQGLPTEYRMRHDSHYVEELGTRTSTPRSEQVPPPPSSVPTTAALRDLCQEFEGLASCFNLIQQGARPLRERLGVTLAKIGVQRSIRYAQHLRLLLEDSHPSRREVRLDELMRQVFGEFKEELRLTESTLSVNLPDSSLLLHGDAALLMNGIRACLGTAIALVEMSGTASDIHMAAFTSGDTLHCEFRQDAYTLEPPELARLFDMESTDRQGGRTIAVALGAAKRVMQLHGGSFDARPTTSGGCVFIFDLPAATSVAAKAN